MNVLTNVNRRWTAALIALVFFLFGLAILRVQAAANDSSIGLKKDQSTGLFVLTIRDPDGILEFSMTPSGKLPYSGGLSGCKKSFVNNTASFADPDDFTPVMTAFVVLWLLAVLIIFLFERVKRTIINNKIQQLNDNAS